MTTRAERTTGRATVRERQEQRRDFAERLLAALSAHGMTQGQLARSVGVGRACVSTWTRGISLPTGARAAAVERVVGLRVDGGEVIGLTTEVAQ